MNRKNMTFRRVLLAAPDFPSESGFTASRTPYSRPTLFPLQGVYALMTDDSVSDGEVQEVSFKISSEFLARLAETYPAVKNRNELLRRAVENMVRARERELRERGD